MSVNNACLEHVNISVGSEVVAVADFAGLNDVVDDNRTLKSRVGSNLANGLFKSLENDLHAGLLVGILGAVKQSLDCGDSVEQCDAAACNGTLFNSCLGCCESVLDAELLLLHLGLGSCADLDDRYAACKLCKALLKLLSVIVGSGVLNLGADLVDSGLDSVLVACAVNNDGVLLGDLDLACAAEIGNLGVLEFKTELGGDDLAAGEDSDIWSISLRLSPKPGALMPTQVNTPRSLLTRMVERASPSMSSAMMISFPPACMICSSRGRRS